MLRKTQVWQKEMFISLILKACCPIRINPRKTESNIYFPRSKACCPSAEQKAHICLPRSKACCPCETRRNICLARSKACFPSGQDSNVSFPLLNWLVTRVEWKAMYISGVLKSCCTSGVEARVGSNILYTDVYLPCWKAWCMFGNTPSDVYLPRWKACCTFGTESDIYIYPVCSVFPKWNRKQCNIFLVLKSCNPSGTQTDLIFLFSKAPLTAGRTEGNKYFSRRSKSYSDGFVKSPVSHKDNTLFYCF